MRILLWVFLLFIILGTVSGQDGLIYSFDMNDCDLSESISGGEGFTFGTMCSCGVNSNGLLFPENTGFAEFEEDLNNVFQGNWSMSFYIQVQNQGTESVDILFLGQSCSLDSVLSLRYLPGSQRFRFLLSNSPNNSVQLDGLADNNSCWQYITLTKDLANVSLYINGLLADMASADSDLILDVPGKFSIGNSPCQNLTNNADVKFEGSVDEFRIYNRPLTLREIEDGFLQPDKILTRDTTIFIGESIQLQTGGTCFQDFFWSPADGLNDENELNPIARPMEDITYTFTVNGENCSSMDEVTIRIADPSDVTCEDLLLPSAFTPNNDRINDRYGISNGFLISQLSRFEIFNKWGGRVFSTSRLTDTWDGMYQGKRAPATSYLYRVEYVCEGSLFTKSGTLNLIR